MFHFELNKANKELIAEFLHVKSIRWRNKSMTILTKKVNQRWWTHANCYLPTRAWCDLAHWGSQWHQRARGRASSLQCWAWQPPRWKKRWSSAPSSPSPRTPRRRTPIACARGQTRQEVRQALWAAVKIETRWIQGSTWRRCLLIYFCRNNKKVSTSLDIMGTLIMLSNGFPNVVHQMPQPFNKILLSFHAAMGETDRG